MLNVNIKESDWPDGAEWVTQDKNGRIDFWTEEPEAAEVTWISRMGDRVGTVKNSLNNEPNESWRNEIMKRPQAQPSKNEPERKHNHYYKDVRHLDFIDVYRVMELYEVTDPCLQHAGKKILVSGKRGAKDQRKDVQEAIDTLQRWIEMQDENERQEKR